MNRKLISAGNSELVLVAYIKQGIDTNVDAEYLKSHCQKAASILNFFYNNESEERFAVACNLLIARTCILFHELGIKKEEYANKWYQVICNSLINYLIKPNGYSLKIIERLATAMIISMEKPVYGHYLKTFLYALLEKMKEDLDATDIEKIKLKLISIVNRFEYNFFGCSGLGSHDEYLRIIDPEGKYRGLHF